MKVKDRGRRAAYRRGATNGWEWRPIGWYNNRPSVLHDVLARGIGLMERFEVITSPVLSGQMLLIQH